MFDTCEKVSTCERDAKTGETGKAGSFHTLPHLEMKKWPQKEYTPWKSKYIYIVVLTWDTNARSSRLDPM